MTASLKASADGLHAIIAVGGVDKLDLDSTGNLTIPGKVVQGVQSMVRVNTANGYGSTNIKIRRFTNVVTNQGTDITYADSATLGASFTVNTSGVYSFSFTDCYNQVATLGLSLNTITPTTAIFSCAPGEQLALETTGAVNFISHVTWIGYLPAGSVVRPHTEGAAVGSQTSSIQFTACKIA